MIQGLFCKRLLLPLLFLTGCSSSIPFSGRERHDPTPPPDFEQLAQVGTEPRVIDAMPEDAKERAHEPGKMKAELKFSGTPGLWVPEGTVVSDGRHSFRTLEEVLIQKTGHSELVASESLNVVEDRLPKDTLKTVVSRVPKPYKVAVTNPKPGVFVGDEAEEAPHHRTSVYVIFSGNPGFIVRKGFAVSDQRHIYRVNRDSAIQPSGETRPVLAVASDPGVWAVPPESVRFINTSTSKLFTITVTNPSEGIPALASER